MDNFITLPNYLSRYFALSFTFLDFRDFKEISCRLRLYTITVPKHTLRTYNKYFIISRNLYYI